MRRRWWLAACWALVWGAGCGREAGEPPRPGMYVAWNKMWPDKAVRSVGFERPNNWTVVVKRRRRQVTVSATSSEFWRLRQYPNAAQTDPATFADALTTRQRRRYGENLLTSHRSETEINELGGIKLDYELLDGSLRGTRYVLAGGWVLEYQYRPAYRALVQPAFVHLTSSLLLTENR
jgi:hypothetical protein